MAIVRPIKYNPAFLPLEELIRSFVVRNKEFDLIMEMIHENNGRANQHILIVGPRGAGKTTLVLRVAAEVIKKKEIFSHWYPIVFSEESYEICSPGEFWLEAIFHVGKHTKEKKWKEIYRELRTEKDDTRLRERALAKLMDFADEMGKRLLIIVENLNVLMGEQISHDDAWTIRHTLLNEPRIMLLGTALNRFEQIENSDKAMFELFKIHELEPLDSDACRDLWKSVTGQDLKGDCIRPVQILTGGSPRLLVIISSFAAKSSLKELMEDLTYLVDEHTEYFKSHIDILPALERKVYVTLADLWQPSTAREVADAARVDVNKASASLKRLVSKGAVMEVEQGGGKKWYQLSERMYNIYHLMRRRGEPSNRVRAVVDFMVHFYTEEDLVRITSLILEEACQIELESRADHYQTIIELLSTSQLEKHRQEIIDNIPKGLLNFPDLPNSLKEMIITPSVERTSITEKEMESIQPNDPDSPNSWIDLGIVLMNELGREKDAEYTFREALKLDHRNLRALIYLATILVHENKLEESEDIFKVILDLNPNLYSVWDMYGYMLQYKLKRYEDAEKAYRKAVEINPGQTLTWEALGNILVLNLNRYEEAEHAYRKAIEADSKNASAWNWFGFLLGCHLNRFEEAEQAITKSIDLNPNQILAWVNLGFLLSLEPKKYSQAEKAFKKAIELDKDLYPAWSGLAMLLSFHSHYVEAEKAYQRALEIEHNEAGTWFQLISLQMEKLRSPEKALLTIKKYIALGERSSERLNEMSKVIFQNGWSDYWDQAEKWSREAVEKSPDEKSYKLTLALILGERNKYEEAIEISSVLVKDNEFVTDNINDIIRLYANISAAGYANEGLKTLELGSSRGVLEPLITGLKIFLGEKVRAPQEILEVGKDVAKRINELIKKQKERSPEDDNP